MKSKTEKKTRKFALKRGDLVMVVAGGNKHKRPLKGQIGKIKSFTGENGDRVVIEGLNLFTRHQRAMGPDKPAGKVKKEKAMHVSNVMYYVESLKRPVRLKTSTLADGKKVRGCSDPKSKKFVQIDQ